MPATLWTILAAAALPAPGVVATGVGQGAGPAAGPAAGTRPEHRRSGYHSDRRDRQAEGRRAG